MATREAKREVRAQAKWVRVSPRKARLVTQHIRGRTVPEARTVLAFTPRAAAREVEKVLKSAVANAEANHGLDGDALFVSAAFVDEGPTLKRWRPRARGRASRIFKRTCHITLQLATADGSSAQQRRSQLPAKTVEEPTASEKAEARRQDRIAAEQEGAAATPDENLETKPRRAPRRKKAEEAEN